MIFRNRGLLIVVFAAALICSSAVVAASVTDVYIAQTVAGAGNGSSCANAYAYTFFSTSRNWGSGSNQIGPGTTVHLCGTFTGAAGATLLTAQGSGASGTPVTILFETGAMMTAPYWANAITIDGLSNVVIDGGVPCGAVQGGQVSSNTCNGVIKNTANGTGLAYHANSNFISASSCNSCEIRNLALINNYVHTQCEGNSGCDTAAGTVENSAIGFSGSNVKIHDNLIHDASWAVNDQANASDVNVSFYNNNVYNVAHGLALYGGNTWAGPVFFYNNRVHDYQNWDTGNADAYHADGIHAFGMNLAVIYIYNNFFQTSNQCCITAHVFLEGGATWTTNGTYYIFNNVFLQPSGAVNGLLQPYIGNSNSIIYNNTIVTADSVNSLALGPSGTHIKIINNVVTSAGFLNLLNGGGGTTFANPATDMDYQAYGNCSGYNCWEWNNIDTGSFSTWASQCSGCDTHSSYSASLALNADGSPSSQSTMIIGKGKNLTSLCSGNLTALCSDILGNPRPASGSWDSGAYAYNSGPPPSPPTGLTATPE